MTKWYTQDHEWLSIDGDTITVGITEHAQEALGEIVYVELPEKGMKSIKGEGIAVVESVKSASDIYAPINGEVININTTLEDSPEIINSSAELEGWFFKLTLIGEWDTSEFMNQTDYANMLEE